jgi:hypothetical protein
MINATGYRAKSSLSRGAVVPVQGHTCRRRPGPGGPPCGGVAKGATPSSKVGGGSGDAGFGAWPLPPSCRAEYASVTAGQMPGVTDQDLRQSEAWLGNHRRLAGVIRAIVAGLPPQAHHRGRGRGEHLARLRCGTGGCVVRRSPLGVDESRIYRGGGSASMESSVLWM